MSDGTKIEWTDATWNPVTGCSVVSPGCTNCYAMNLAGTRLRKHPSREGLTIDTKAGPVWNGKVRFNEQWLSQPLQWKRPRMVFVCAHGDLFHEDVPDEWIHRVFAVMALCPQHTFQVLTKRSARMREYCDRGFGRLADVIMSMRTDKSCVGPLPHIRPGASWWPLANVWLGVSAEDQKRADERIPDLLSTPAAVRFVSAEPLLDLIDLRSISNGHWFCNALTGARWHDAEGGATDKIERLDWVIAGGESGKSARPMHPDWARSLRDQCTGSGVAFFFKQYGEWGPMKHTHAGFAEAGSLERFTCVSSTDRTRVGTASWHAGRGEKLPVEILEAVGKKTAGRLLDGREWNDMPAPAGKAVAA